MGDFRWLAARIDQQMQQLAAEHIIETVQIFNRMTAYMPDLHKIWNGASDAQLLTLADEYPGFYNFAMIVANAMQAERLKGSRPYDSLTPCTPEQRKTCEQLLEMGATLERGFQAYRNCGDTHVFQPQIDQLNTLHQQWLRDIVAFKAVLANSDTAPQTVGYINEVFSTLMDRIQRIAVPAA
jgi:hypothetical protein